MVINGSVRGVPTTYPQNNEIFFDMSQYNNKILAFRISPVVLPT